MGKIGQYEIGQYTKRKMVQSDAKVLGTVKAFKFAIKWLLP